MRLKTVLLVGVVAGLLVVRGAVAADLGSPPAFAAPALSPASGSGSFFSEVRLGSFAHDATSPEKGSADLNGEILFAKPFSMPGSAWDFLLPRPSIGATINFAGKTSQAYAGLAWTYDITQSLFVEGSFGGSVNNGKTGGIAPVGHIAMGCHWSFRESASVGYRFNANWILMGTIEHMSNAGLCSQNRGLTNYGVRIGYSF
jgi:hypothetical protein